MSDVKKTIQKSPKNSVKPEQKSPTAVMAAMQSPAEALTSPEPGHNKSEQESRRVANLQDKIDELESTVSTLHTELSDMRSKIDSARSPVHSIQNSLQEQVEYRQQLHQGRVFARVAVSKLVLRIGPADHYSAISSLPKGTSVRVLNSSSSWTRIECASGLTAWAPSYALQFAE